MHHRHRYLTRSLHSSITYVNFEIDIFAIEKDHRTHETLLDWLGSRVFADRMPFAIGLGQIGDEFAVRMIIVVDFLV